MEPQDEAQAQTHEALGKAIESLNKAYAVLAAGQGLSGGVTAGLSRAGCTEYCGSYDGCTGYCKPMGAQLQLDPGRPPEKQLAPGALRMPFAQ
jgi:hypothetical protein